MQKVSQWVGMSLVGLFVLATTASGAGYKMRFEMSKIVPQSLIGILLGLVLVAIPNLVRADSPPVTDNLVLHLDAQAFSGLNDNDRIGQWDDLSGQDHHVTQSTEANQPWYDAQAIHDALPAVRFEGDQWLRNNVALSQPGHVFAVFRQSNATDKNTEVIWDGREDESAGNIIFTELWSSSDEWRMYVANPFVFDAPTNGLSEFGVFTVLFNSSSSHARFNGNELGTGDVGSGDLYILTLGADRDDGRAFNGHIAELLIYEAELSGTDMESIETYLTEKWIDEPTPENPNLPEIATTDAVDVHTNQATLTGTLSSTGTSVTAVSVYWEQTDTDQGTNTTDWSNEESFGDYTSALGELPYEYATNITGLAAGTQYTYRYYATNDAGEVWGAPESFTTYEAPGVPTIDAPSETGFVHVVISGAVTGGIPDPLAYFCLNAGSDDGTGSTGDWDIVESAGVQSGAFTNMITGLQDDTNYYARVYVTNDAGEAWSSDIQFSTEELPEQLTLNGDHAIGQSVVDLGFVETPVPLSAVVDGADWLYDFGSMGDQPLNFNLAGHSITYTRENNTDRGPITFDIGGGAISNHVSGVPTNGLSIKTTPRSSASDGDKKRSDHVVITNVAAIRMGGIDTAAAIEADSYNDPYGGSITIGRSDAPVPGMIQVEYLHSYGGVYGDGGAYAGGGSISLYGGGDALIVDADGVAGDIWSWSSRASAGRILVQHKGSFTANELDASIFAGGSGSESADITLDGGDSSGDMTSGSILSTYTGGNYGGQRPSITILNYNNVTIDGSVETWTTMNNQYTAPPGDVTITDTIAGDINITGAIDLSAADPDTTQGAIELACTGRVTLAELDLDKMRYAQLDSGSGESRITGVVTNFDATSTGGSGTESDPYTTAETRLRAPEGQVVYYEYSAGSLNTDLGGDVWQLPNLDNSGDGGLLMVEPPSGTIFIVR